MHSVKVAVIFMLFCVLPVSAITERRNVKIEIKSHDDVYILHNMGVSIENLRDNYIETSLYPEEIKNLIDAGYKVTERTLEKIARQGYHDYYETEDYLDSMHTLYPNLSRKEVIGFSVLGKNISAFLITDYPDSEEAEPEIKFGATIHGDEPVGTENSLKLISLLLDNYGIDDSITWLVDNTEIWFIPIANPDGRQAGSRRNANNVDLNRNYPVPDGSIGEDGTYDWEPETEAMINFSCAHNFVISTMFHGGALVVNYVWDYSPDPAPDSGLIQLVSLGYTWRNGRMWTNGLGYHGTIDGWYWYPVYGSLQDWAYDSTSCIDLTIELDSWKWPPSSWLPGLWDENRDAMIYLIEKTNTGIAGVVTDSLTGEPLYAEVQALEYGKPLYTDPDVGDYHKLLRDGFYTMQFTSPEYVARTFENVYVSFDSLTNLDVCMYKPFGSLSGIVRDSATQDSISGVNVTVIGSPIDPVYTDTLGFYSLNPYQGTYVVSFSANGYRSLVIQDLEIGETTILDVKLHPYESHYYVRNDAFNIPDNDTITDTLLINDSITISDINVYLDITHTNVRDLAIILTSPNQTSITLHNRSGREFPFWFDVNNPADGPGSLGDFIGESSYGAWILTVIDKAGEDTGQVNQWAIRLYSEPTEIEEIVTEHQLPTIRAYPNPFMEQTVISYQLSVIGKQLITDDRSPITLSIYDISGRLVRTIPINLCNPDKSVKSVLWDGRDNNGNILSAGIYFYRYKGENFDEMGKLVMIR
ncbi:carboxypeptidase regulatory-like domain-containing protein [candidate division WOR-3 bacterium]|nr:carboxypeptidase regulatory-like domain-containing protein [candidate division WOR-3 bacterium]